MSGPAHWNHCDFCGALSREYEPWLGCSECMRDVCRTCDTSRTYDDGPDANPLCRECRNELAARCPVCGDFKCSGRACAGTV